MQRVALIGLGNIGLLFDANLSAPLIRSHAKAILLQKGLELAYAVDPLPERRELLASLSPRTQCFASWEELRERTDFSILAICVPTELHFRCLEAFAEHPVKVIALEKPAFARAEDYARLPPTLEKKIVVNYLRRFAPKIQEVHQHIRAGTYGPPLALQGAYSKGLRNNGSHLVDLINFLFDQPKVLESRVLGSVPDLEGDPTVSAFLRLEERGGVAFSANLLAGDERLFSIFELDLLFAKARVRLSDFARRLEISFVHEDPVSPGYRALGEAQCTLTDLPRAFAGLYDHLLARAHGEVENLSAFASERWNHALIESLAQGQSCSVEILEEKPRVF